MSFECVGHGHHSNTPRSLHSEMACPLCCPRGTYHLTPPLAQRRATKSRVSPYRVILRHGSYEPEHSKRSPRWSSRRLGNPLSRPPAASYVFKSRDIDPIPLSQVSGPSNLGSGSHEEERDDAAGTLRNKCLRGRGSSEFYPHGRTSISYHVK